MKKIIALLLICLLARSALALQKNVADQKIGVYAFNNVTGLAETGDAANITAYIWQDWASGAVVADTNPTELDSTNAPGIYVFDITQADSNGDAVHLYAVSATANIELDPVTYHTTPSGFPAINIASGIVESNMKQVSDDSGAADNFEATYDGTGYADDVAPATQLQLTGIGGGVSIATIATGSTVAEGEETLTYAATATHDDAYYEVASDAINDDIDFFLTFNTGSGMNFPILVHIHGYYEDNDAPANSTLTIESWNFNIGDWEIIETLSDSASDLNIELPLHVHDVDPSGGGEGDVRIRFKLVATEVSQNMRIDHASVNYVSGAVSAADVVDEWETQSQSDPTGFHVNLLEVEGSDATTYIESRTLATAAYFLFGSDDVTLADGVTHGGETATLTLKTFTVSNPDGDAVTYESTGNHGYGMTIEGDGIGYGVYIEGGELAGGVGVYVHSALSDAVKFKNPANRYGLVMEGGIGDILADEIDDLPTVSEFNDRTLAAAAYFIFGTDPVELLDSGGTAGTSAAELVTDIWQKDISGFSNTAQAGGILEWLFNLSEGDQFIDTTTTPWQAVTNKKGTPATEYLRKDLFGVDGSDITSVATVIGKQTEP